MDTVAVEDTNVMPFFFARITHYNRSEFLGWELLVGVVEGWELIRVVRVVNLEGGKQPL